MRETYSLPDSHRRSLSVTAQMVEESLDELENLLRSRGQGGLTTDVEPTYSEEDRARILAAISKLRGANAGMFRSLGLQPSHYPEDQILNAKRAHLWTILVDSKSGGLKRFGEMSPECALAIDFHVDKLLELLKELH